MENTHTGTAGHSDRLKDHLKDRLKDRLKFSHSGPDHMEVQLNNPEDNTSSLHEPTVEAEKADSSASLPCRQSTSHTHTTPTLGIRSSPTSVLKSNPILQVVFPQSSPFNSPSKSGGRAIYPADTPSSAPPPVSASSPRPTSPQALDSEDEFWLGTSGNAHSHLKNIQLLDLNQIATDLNAVEEEITNFKRKIAASNLTSSRARKMSKYWGWGTIVGMTSMAAVVTMRVNK